jgi:hypothetical protein
MLLLFVEVHPRRWRCRVVAQEAGAPSEETAPTLDRSLSVGNPNHQPSIKSLRGASRLNDLSRAVTRVRATLFQGPSPARGEVRGTLGPVMMF